MATEPVARSKRARAAAAGRASPFLQAYTAGTPEEVPEPAVRRRGRRLAEAAPAGPVALRGCILTPDGPLERHWLVVEDGRIGRVTSRRPAGALAVDTGGVVLPGLLDLHGHPEFNVFAPWEPPRTYVNRYAWRGSEVYQQLVRDPQDRLVPALPAGTQLRYAEVRALVGGVTAIQGASGQNRSTDESLVRNVDLRIFGQHRARTAIDLPSSLTGRGGDTFARVLTAIAAGEVDAHYLHLAEGRRDNQRSVDELDHLVSLGGLTPATVVIHGSALTRDQLGSLADAGAKLVWSPQSNLRLYGETTRAADALEVGLPMALGADWLPSGSTSLLAEVKVARQELANQGAAPPARRLVDVLTAEAAAVAGLADHLGSLLPGRVADVCVLQRLDEDPYESVLAALPMHVELVTIGGDLAYGRADWVRALAAAPASPTLEPVLAWGKPMLLDTSFHAGTATGAAPPLARLRADLTRVYPPVGPIWA